MLSAVTRTIHQNLPLPVYFYFMDEVENKNTPAVSVGRLCTPPHPTPPHPNPHLASDDLPGDSQVFMQFPHTFVKQT